jgi:hypothetical protein
MFDCKYKMDENIKQSIIPLYTFVWTIQFVIHVHVKRENSSLSKKLLER